jgi:hypothetical protein
VVSSPQVFLELTNGKAMELFTFNLFIVILNSGNFFIELLIIKVKLYFNLFHMSVTHL